MKVKENGNGTLDAKFGWGEIGKVAGIVVGALTLIIVGLNYLDFSPETAKDIEARLTRNEVSLAALTENCKTMMAAMGLVTAKVGTIEANRFTVQDGVMLREQITSIKEDVSHLPPEKWR